MATQRGKILSKVKFFQKCKQVHPFHAVESFLCVHRENTFRDCARGRVQNIKQTTCNKVGVILWDMTVVKTFSNLWAKTPARINTDRSEVVRLKLVAANDGQK